MKAWISATCFLLFFLLCIEEAQGQTCTMVNQVDKKISDAFAASLTLLSGPTDLSTCSDACLNEDTCAVVEFRGRFCLSLDNSTSLVDNAGSTSAIKVCISDVSTLPFDLTTEDSAHTARPLSAMIGVTAVFASVLSRRQ
ncbi:hypothetical protein RRG08_021626 [Elysia crispata]|uniref:Apple domain-containing protein n=1 Tax=Elysia crispata TaxID=231223 RepID=A0AAE1CEL8_9GAST|nr:hypothetical protein RRG08_021626 [Elysia crispata]